MWSAGYKVKGVGLKVQGVRCRVCWRPPPPCRRERVKGIGFEVKGAGSRAWVQGEGCRVRYRGYS